MKTKRKFRGNTIELYGKESARVYRIWTGMKTRTINKNNPDYKKYGGRGIKVGVEWLRFESFFNDMWPTYYPGATLDRIDNNGNYCKDNCRWATLAEQNKNKNNNIKYKGETASDASRRLGGSENVVTKRLAKGWSNHKSFNHPVRHKAKKNV